MKHHFNDITSRISESPSWWDSNGTPRYGQFKPDMCPFIYTGQVFLIEIACQACGQRFKVEMNTNLWDAPLVMDQVRTMHYGDPPAHDCVGDTMNCCDIRILEAWQYDHDVHTRVRRPDLEIRLEDWPDFEEESHEHA